MAFDSLRRSTEASTDLILDRVEDRVKRGIAEEKEVNRTFGIVGTAMNKSKSATVRKIDEANAKGVNFLRSKDGLAFCKKLSNPWTAWGKTGPLDGDQDAQLRSNLQSILKPSDNKAVNQARRYARQVWRTEMTEYIIKKANEKTGNPPAPIGNPQIIESVLAAQKATSSEDSPAEALVTAVNLDPKIKSKAVRATLATKMNASKVTGETQNVLTALSLNTTPDKVTLKILIGGAFVQIPTGLSGRLTFKNAYLDSENNRIYAQMKNGCEGNLVIIEIPDGTPRLTRDPDPEQPGLARDPEKPAEDPQNLIVLPQPGPGAQTEPDPDKPGFEKVDETPHSEFLIRIKTIIKEKELTYPDGTTIEAYESPANDTDPESNSPTVVLKNLNLLDTEIIEWIEAENDKRFYTINELRYENLEDAVADSLFIHRIEKQMLGKRPEEGSKSAPYSPAEMGDAIEFAEKGVLWNPEENRSLWVGPIGQKEISTLLNERFRTRNTSTADVFDEERGFFKELWEGKGSILEDSPERVRLKSKLDEISKRQELKSNSGLALWNNTSYNYKELSRNLKDIEAAIAEVKTHSPESKRLLQSTDIFIDLIDRNRNNRRREYEEADVKSIHLALIINPLSQSKDEMVASMLAGLKELYPEFDGTSPEPAPPPPVAPPPVAPAPGAAPEEELLGEDTNEPEAAPEATETQFLEAVSNILPSLGHRENVELRYGPHTDDYFQMTIVGPYTSVDIAAKKYLMRSDVEIQNSAFIWHSKIFNYHTLRDTLANALYISAIETKMHNRTPEKGREFDPYEVDGNAIDFKEAVSPWDPDLSPGKNATSTPLEEIRDTLNYRVKTRRLDVLASRLDDYFSLNATGSKIKSITFAKLDQDNPDKYFDFVNDPGFNTSLINSIVTLSNKSDSLREKLSQTNLVIDPSSSYPTDYTEAVDKDTKTITLFLRPLNYEDIPAFLEDQLAELYPEEFTE